MTKYLHEKTNDYNPFRVLVPQSKGLQLLSCKPFFCGIAVHETAWAMGSPAFLPLLPMAQDPPPQLQSLLNIGCAALFP